MQMSYSKKANIGHFELSCDIKFFIFAQFMHYRDPTLSFSEHHFGVLIHMVHSFICHTYTDLLPLPPLIS